MRVFFLGPRTDMPGVYRSLDLLVLPSLNEGMPMTLLEAMAAGVPVIATRVGAIPNIIDDGRNGLLIDVGDPCQIGYAIERMLSCPEERRWIGTAGQRWVVENASISRSTERYFDHYQDAIADRAQDFPVPALT